MLLGAGNFIIVYTLIKVPERGPDAWQIRPGSYFLLPFKEAFGRQIPRDFTIFLTIKPTDESEVRLRPQ